LVAFPIFELESVKYSALRGPESTLEGLRFGPLF
jgi:hypothetical protein